MVEQFKMQPTPSQQVKTNWNSISGQPNLTSQFGFSVTAQICNSAGGNKRPTEQNKQDY
jgi:hypothetical protein